MKRRYRPQDEPAIMELQALLNMMQRVLAKAKGNKLNDEQLQEWDRIGELLRVARAKYIANNS